MMDSAFSTASDKENVEILFYTQEGDDKEKDYPGCGHNVTAILGFDWPTVMTWNYLSHPSRTKASLLMLASDDMIFATPGWDKALLDHYNALENKIHVYHLQDSRDVEGTPHPIVTREYIHAMGYFMPPIFLHWFVDTWTREIGKANGVFSHLKEFELIHDKPSDKGQADETHNRIRRNGWHARDLYVNETCQHFLELEKQRLAMAMK